jgi:hypothetical protein
MHWLDRAARLSAARMPPNKRPFNLGWGDRDVVQWYLDNARVVPPIADIDVRVRPARRSGAIVVRDLEFESPFEMLPAAARRVRARWISTNPEPGRRRPAPSWNDETELARLARDLIGRGGCGDSAASALRRSQTGEVPGDPGASGERLLPDGPGWGARGTIAGAIPAPGRLSRRRLRLQHGGQHRRLRRGAGGLPGGDERHRRRLLGRSSVHERPAAQYHRLGRPRRRQP